MDEENKKINLESFFKKVDSVEQVANSALSRANSNLGIINNQKALIESLSVGLLIRIIMHAQHSTVCILIFGYQILNQVSGARGKMNKK